MLINRTTTISLNKGDTVTINADALFTGFYQKILNGAVVSTVTISSSTTNIGPFNEQYDIKIVVLSGSGNYEYSAIDKENVENLTWSEKPSASDFGVGQAWFSDLGLMGYSDGIDWRLTSSNNLGTARDITFIGDSRSNYGHRPFWKSCTTVSGSYDGLPVLARGCGKGITTDDITGASCFLEWNPETKSLRWTAPSDTAGPWTKLNDSDIWITLQSGTADKWLYLGIQRNSAFPTTSKSLPMRVSGSMLTGPEVRGYQTTLIAGMYYPESKVNRFAVGGMTTTGLYASIASHKSNTLPGGVDIVRIGTNDISAITSGTGPAVLTVMQNNMTAYLNSRIAAGRKIIIIGETARLASGTLLSSPVALSAEQLAALLDYNEFLSDYAASNPGYCRYVDTYAITVDRTAYDGRHKSLALIDHVHDDVLGGINIANLVKENLIDMGIKVEAPYAIGNPLCLMGTNYSCQATSAAALGTGASGVTPTTVTNTMAQAAGTCTGVGSVTARSNGQGNWFTMTCAATANTSIFQWRSASKTLAALGKAVGDDIRFEMELDVVNGNLVNYIDIFLQFTGASPTHNLHLRSKDSSTTPNESNASYSGRFSSTVETIPTGTTSVSIFIYVGMQNGGSSVVNFANVVIE